MLNRGSEPIDLPTVGTVPGYCTSTIAIGDALLRLAERAWVQQEKERYAAAFMPFQVGVGVRGGLSVRYVG